MKFVKVSIICTILSILLFPLNGVASLQEQLPSLKSSKVWEVVIDKPKSNEIKSKPNDVYNIYSMDIKYVGNENIKIERVEAYRDDPSSSFDFELFTADLESVKNSGQQYFRHQNFPISKQATNLKVFVTWTKTDDNSRSFREEFNFKQ